MSKIITIKFYDEIELSEDQLMEMEDTTAKYTTTKDVEAAISYIKKYKFLTTNQFRDFLKDQSLCSVNGISVYMRDTGPNLNYDDNDDDDDDDDDDNEEKDYDSETEFWDDEYNDDEEEYDEQVDLAKSVIEMWEKEGDVLAPDAARLARLVLRRNK